MQESVNVLQARAPHTQRPREMNDLRKFYMVREEIGSGVGNGRIILRRYLLGTV